MYKELVGSTAIRKSSKIREIVDEFGRRVPQITDKEDLVNYCYFLARLQDFDIASRLERQHKNDLVARGIESTVRNAEKMEFENVLRFFADATQIDPAIPLANKILDMIKFNQNKQLNEKEASNHWKILRYILRSKNPRLYMSLAKQVVL